MVTDLRGGMTEFDVLLPSLVSGEVRTSVPLSWGEQSVVGISSTLFMFCFIFLARILCWLLPDTLPRDCFLFVRIFTSWLIAILHFVSSTTTLSRFCPSPTFFLAQVFRISHLYLFCLVCILLLLFQSRISNRIPKSDEVGGVAALFVSWQKAHGHASLSRGQG